MDAWICGRRNGKDARNGRNGTDGRSRTFRTDREKAGVIEGLKKLAEKTLASPTCWVQNGEMKTSVDLDEDLAAEVERTVSLTHEKPATILRMAIRAGLPVVANRFQAPRPDGHFTEAYRKAPKERLEFEDKMAKATVQKPER